MKEEMIWYFLLLMALLFITNHLFLKLYIKYSNSHKIIAIPNERSIHKKITPTGGGLVFGFLHIVFLLLSIRGLDVFHVKESVLKLCYGGFLILFLGFIDDKFSLKANYKLFFQIIISLFMVLLDFKITQISNPFGTDIILGYLSIPITVFWYILIMNSINLIDGLDGLATGIMLITCLVLAIFSFFSRNFLVFLNTTFLFISLLSFLKYNFPPAKIFMGDTGSLFIGFLVASLAIAGNENQYFKGLTTITLLLPMTVMSIPLIDTIFTIFRRLKSKQLIFKADKNHIHHKLINLGLSQISVMYLSWFITFIFGLIALGYFFIRNQLMVLLIIIIYFITTGLFFYIYKKEILNEK